MMNKNQPKVLNNNDQDQRSSEAFYDDEYVQNTLSLQRFNQECCFINFFVCFIFTIGIYVLLSYDLASKNIKTVDSIHSTNSNSYNDSLNNVFTDVDNLTHIIFNK